MTAPYRPHSAPRKSPADVWESLVSSGLSEDAATAAVAKQYGPPPAPPKDPSLWEKLKTADWGKATTDVGNELLQGASFGWADEAAGLVSPEVRDAMRKRSAELRAASPGAAFAANLLGGVATGGGAVKAGAKLFPRVAGGGIKAALLRGAANAGEGATAGAVAGAGAGESPEGRIYGALMGAAGGAVLGGGLPVLGNAVKGVRRAVLPFSEKGASRVADEMIGNAIDDARSIVVPVIGKPMQLVDRLGEAGRKLARGARTTSSSARQTFADMSAERMPGTAERVIGDVNDALGVGGQTVRQLGKGLDDARAAISKAEFTPERMAAPVTSETVKETLLKSPVYRRAHRAFREAAKLDPNAEVPPPLFGKDGLTREPTVRDIENIRQGLQDLLDTGGYQVVTKTGERAVKNITKAGKKAIDAARKALLNDKTLNAEHPWYQPARAALAGKHAEGRALMAGEKLAGAVPADVADALGALGSSGEQQMARAGLANRIARKVNESPAISASRVAGGGPNIPGRMARLTAASASPDAAATLRARLAAEDQIAATERFLTGQSETADKALEGAGIGMKALQKALRLGSGAKEAVLMPLAAAAQGNTGKVSKALADKLGNLTPDEQQLYLRYIQQFMEQQMAKQAARRGYTAGAIGGGMAGTR